MKKYRTVLVIIVLLLIFAGVVGYYLSHRQPSLKSSKQTPEANTELSFLLKNYPKDIVPLYQLVSVSSSKFFVNKDPSHREDYFGSRVNYYNVVFRTKANPQETFRYYRSLMSEENTESVPTDRIEGKIGKYKVSVGQYPDATPKEIYLSVYLPTNEYQAVNRYYQNYPQPLAIPDTWAEYESSYGLLNQNGGEEEYTQYFPLPEQEEEQTALIQEYKNKYQSEVAFNFNPQTGLMTWSQDDNTIYLTFSKAHGRTYLMIRRPM